MGTSTSSSGGKAGSPFDPEWLTPDSSTGGGAAGDAGSAEQGQDGENESGETPEAGSGDIQTGEATVDGAFAPSRRFADARTKMSTFLGGGGRESLRAAAKSMVAKGMGGSRRAASTMRGTAQGAGALGQFLASARDRSDPRVVDWVAGQATLGRSRQALFDRDGLSRATVSAPRWRGALRALPAAA